MKIVNYVMSILGLTSVLGLQSAHANNLKASLTKDPLHHADKKENLDNLMKKISIKNFNKFKGNLFAYNDHDHSG